MPVGVEERKEAVADADLTGVAAPMSTPSRAPCGLEAPLTWRQVTTARPRPLVPRSGSMATAMGFWSTATVPGVRVPMGLAGGGGGCMVGEGVGMGGGVGARVGFWGMGAALG